MGDFWSGNTDYDRNETQRNRERDAEAEAVRKETEKRLQETIANPGQQFDIYGNNDQLANTQAQLSQVGVMTGQGVVQAGQQQQDYYNSLQKRRNGEDATAANMIAGRNRNLANLGRQFAGRGVAGGVAAAGMNTATNTADSEINAQKQKFATSNDKELWNYVKRNQKVTGEALAAGEDKGLAQSMDTSAAEGAFGTVICTELYMQGLLSIEVYEEDIDMGKFIEYEFPNVMAGYRFLAAPIVRKMRKSKKFTKCVAFFAVPWAKRLSGEENLRGLLVLTFGFPLCWVVGSLLPRKQVEA